MLFELLRSVTFFQVLHQMDLDLAVEQQRKGCPHCGGPLHRASYLRKPRGGPANLPEEYSLRHSLCCGRVGCRRRSLPPSCLFLERRVYWGAIVLVATALRQQRTQGYCVRKLKEILGVTHQTLLRWLAFFREVFPTTQLWKKLRGRVSPQLSNEALPASLLSFFLQSHALAQDGLIACLRFLSIG